MATASAIVSMADFEEPVNALIYADPGDGKTALLATAPDSVFVNCDPGIVTAKRRGSTADVWPVRRWSDFIDFIDYVEKNPRKWKHVLIEGLTVLQDMLLRNMVQAAHSQNPAKRHEVIPAQDNYLEQQLRLTQAISRLNAVPVHKWYTAHVMRTEDTENVEPLWLPLIHGKNYAIAQKVCAMMGVVAYLWIPDELEDDAPFENRIRFRKKAPHMALKTQFPGLPPVVKNPTIPALMRMIEKGAAATPTTARKRTAGKRPVGRTRKAAN